MTTRGKVDYQKGLVYTIFSRLDKNLFYIGSTTNIDQRWKYHKGSMRTKKKQHIKLYSQMLKDGVENFYIELYEYHPCKTKKELEQFEGQIQRKLNPPLNAYVAGRGPKDYYDENRENILVKKREYYIKNKEAKKVYKKTYNENHREEIKERNKKKFEANKDYYKKKQKQYYDENREVLLERQKQRDYENIERKTQYNKQYYQRNKEAIKEQHKEYIRNKKDTLDNIE